MRRIVAYFMIFAAALSCSKTGTGEGNGIFQGNRPISLLSGQTGNDGFSPAFPESTKGVFAITAYRESSPAGDYGNAYFDNIGINTDADGVLYLAYPQFYPSDGDKLHFYAYAPAGTALSDGRAVYSAGKEGIPPSVSWKIDGKTDILWAKDDSGSDKDTEDAPSLSFSHLLQKIRFRLIMGEGYGDNVSASEIRITDSNTQAVLNLITGKLEFSGNADDTLSIEGPFPITREGYDTPYLLCEPSASIQVEVDAAGITYRADVPLQVPDGTSSAEGGVSYTVSLTFIGTHIKPSTGIYPWEDAGSADGVIQ